MTEALKIERLYNAIRPCPDALETICLREMQRMAPGEVRHDTIRMGGLLLAVKFERTAEGLRVTEGETEGL
jgi:hypothetical protein